MPEKVQRRDVLVIGAGFCGTALAAALKHYGVESFSVLEKGVCFSDKTEQAFDAVVLATGFRHGLEEFLDDHASLLGPRPPAPGAYPITDLRSRSTVWPSLFFVGFDITLMGGLSWGNWGWEVGQKVAEELRS